MKAKRLNPVETLLQGTHGLRDQAQPITAPPLNPPRYVDRLCHVFDTIKGAHYSVRLRIDTDALAVALAKKALRSKGKRSRMCAGAIEVKIHV